MVYVWEFEFFDGDGGYVDAFPCPPMQGATFGGDLEDAVASAADWLKETVLDSLMGYCELPPMSFGHNPENGGRIIAVAVDCGLKDIPAMTLSDAAEELGISPACAGQLIEAGLLESWVDGAERMVSKTSIEARRRAASKAGGRKPPVSVRCV